MSFSEDGCTERQKPTALQQRRGLIHQATMGGCRPKAEIGLFRKETVVTIRDDIAEAGIVVSSNVTTTGSFWP